MTQQVAAAPYLITMKTPQSAFSLGFQAESEAEAVRFARNWIDTVATRAKSEISLTTPDGTVSVLVDSM